MQSPETLFFFRVTFPAWLQYGKPPIVLLNKALKGTLADIDDLLRLDPLMIEDPRIRPHYMQALRQGKTSQLNLIHKAVTSPPRGTFSLKRVKVSMASLVFKAAKVIDDSYRQTEAMTAIFGAKDCYPSANLSYKDIRELFDAVQKDMDPAERYSSRQAPCDPDLPEGDDALKMAIYRDQSFWPDFKRDSLVTKLFSRL